MDPNEALKNARKALTAYVEFSSKEDATGMALAAADLADAFEALDHWMSGGGFRPHAWDK